MLALSLLLQDVSHAARVVEFKGQDGLPLDFGQVLGLEGGAYALITGRTGFKRSLANLNELNAVKDARVGRLAGHLELELV